MEDLQLDTASFARVMAQTLATLYWEAGVDGNDVELILGSSSVRITMPISAEISEDDEWSLAERFDLISVAGLSRFGLLTSISKYFFLFCRRLHLEQPMLSSPRLSD